VVTLNPETIQQIFHQSGKQWTDIGADFQNALHTAIGWGEANWNDTGSAVSLPWYEHPGTWAAGIVAGGYACIVYCGEVAVTIGGVGTSISQGATQLFAYCLANSFCARLLGYGAKPDNATIVRNLADQVAEETGGVLGEAALTHININLSNPSETLNQVLHMIDAAKSQW
jgi:hypothetical protein